MKKMAAWNILILAILLTSNLQPAIADSLSAALGATNLDGLSKFSDCQNESIGYREGLIANRLELKLANTPHLNPEERKQWLTDIAILRQVQRTRQPDRTNSQHYLLGLTDQEQMAINSMSHRHSQEINLKCEQQYGGMTRYSSGSDQSGQLRYENQLRVQMAQPVMNLDAIPVTPFEREKSAAELEQERKARHQSVQQAAMQKFNNCATSAKGLRPKLVAQALQRKLDNGSGLSAKDRTEIQADIQAAWVSAGKGLDQIESADPKNPYRAEQRLTLQDQTEINNEYMKQYTQQMQNCTSSAIPQSASF